MGAPPSGREWKEGTEANEKGKDGGETDRHDRQGNGGIHSVHDFEKMLSWEHDVATMFIMGGLDSVGDLLGGVTGHYGHAYNYNLTSVFQKGVCVCLCASGPTTSMGFRPTQGLGGVYRFYSMYLGSATNKLEAELEGSVSFVHSQKQGESLGLETAPFRVLISGSEESIRESSSCKLNSGYLIDLNC
ncbi:hypothetical protein FNV43_RR06789 [Rhamnella rubrinervis]|uniref:Uncharacterized protein n=1 Tax=Rhamnella rubrinervis TaxID=2594499 RepID=A0A8K0HE66_9ROSA|nr:hypothetical protein FNV43_RR06789 [Rhamnella rubrinervis]